MKKNLHFYRIIIIGMLGVMLSFGSTVFAESIEDVEDEINKIEKEKEKLKEEQGSLDDDKTNTDSKIDENKGQQASVEEQLETITNKLESTQASIDVKESEITTTNEEIEKLNKQVKTLKKEIKQLKKRIKERDKLLKNRLVSIQKNGGGIQYLEVIFGSQNFGDFISRSSAVTTIMDQDKKIMEVHMEDKSDLETKQVTVEEKTGEVESEKATLESQKNELVALKDTLDSQKSSQNTLMAQLESEFEQLSEYKVSIEEEEEILIAETNALEKAQQVSRDRKGELEQLAKKKKEEERKQEQARLEAEKAKEEDESEGGNTLQTDPTPSQSVPNLKSGDFIWPVQGRISSEYGYRVHPIFNTKRLHSGIDIANSAGTDVIATAPGVVISGSYMGGYGNAVLIAHSINGKSYTTLYGHLSSMSVSEGQVVNQGDSIGKVGSTGNSTGPHLHFEVYIGGYDRNKEQTENPRNFLPK